jgi:hypothetical protein
MDIPENRIHNLNSSSKSNLNHDVLDPHLQSSMASLNLNHDFISQEHKFYGFKY